MRLIYSILFLFLSFSLFHARMYYTFLFGNFEMNNVTNLSIVNEYTNWLEQALKNKKFFPAELSGNGSLDQADYIISGAVRQSSERYTTQIFISETTNKIRQWSDEVYTEDVWSLNGIRESAKVLAERIIRLVKNQQLPPYRERHDYKKEFSIKASVLTNASPVNARMFNLINIPMSYPYGFRFDFPLAFGLELFQIEFTWFIPSTRLGLGIGTKAFDIHGTNAGSILPLTVFVPLYIAPSDYGFGRSDIYFTAEWGFFIPQYSYVDLSFKLIMNGISFSIGWIMLPGYADVNYSRQYYDSFYAGLTLMFGSYQVDWEAK